MTEQEREQRLQQALLTTDADTLDAIWAEDGSFERLISR